MAAQAADRASDEQVARIASQVGRLAASLRNPERYKRGDTEFHDAVAAASGNDMASTIVAAIQSKARASAQYAETDTPLGLLALSQEGHVAVYEAIAARDPARAARAMREHIRSAWAWRHDEPVAPQTPRDGSAPATQTLPGGRAPARSAQRAGTEPARSPR
jgi:DNA-binding FadR family transcriptional regulator